MVLEARTLRMNCFTIQRGMSVCAHELGPGFEILDSQELMLAVAGDPKGTIEGLDDHEYVAVISSGSQHI